MRSIVILAAMILSVAATSCEKHDVLSADNLPGKISTFITTHFPESSVTSAVKEKENGVTRYEILLSNGFELEFNGSYNIIDIKGTSQLPDAVIPAKIREYVVANYSSNYIVEWELDDRRQKIELNNGLDLEFSKTGDFIRIDY